MKEGAIIKNAYIYNTEIGTIAIMDNGNEITDIYFNDENIPKDAIITESKLIKEAKKQLDEYLTGMRKMFNIPILAEGTEFQRSVWAALLKIPYGETRCYSEIAESIGNPKASRAVGLANNKNPISIIIPCHRVIGKSGKLVGYGGGLEIKERLLNLEKA